MSWERHRTSQVHVDDPELTIYTNLNAYINLAADNRYCEGFEECLIHRDVDNARVAIEPVDDGDYSLSRAKSKRGIDVALRSALQAIGLDDDTLEESVKLPLTWSEDVGLVADVSDLLEQEQMTEDDDSPVASAEKVEMVAESDIDSEPEPEPDEDTQAVEYHGSTTDKVVQWLSHNGSVGTEFQASEIADDIDEHAAGIGRALSQLDATEELGFGVTKNETDTMGTATWICIDPVGGEDADDTSGASSELPGTLTEADVHAVAEHYSTLSEVATDLEVSLERARAILSERGLLMDLEQATGGTVDAE